MGNRAYGVAAAAHVYYGKSLEELSLAQIAMIAGLPKAPSTYNPIANPQRALLRRNWILGRMLSLDNITREQYQAAVAEQDNAPPRPAPELTPPISPRWCARVISKFGLKGYTQGYSAITTIDSGMQKSAVKALQAGIMAYDKATVAGPSRLPWLGKGLRY